MVGHMEFDMGTRFEYVTRDYAKAREFYEKSIEHGYGLAMFNLGMYIVNGGEDALVRIIYLLARSLALFVSKGKKCTYIHVYILKSQLRLTYRVCTGTWYLEGKNGVACDPLRARQLFEMAADKVCAYNVG